MKAVQRGQLTFYLHEDGTVYVELPPDFMLKFPSLKAADEWYQRSRRYYPMSALNEELDT